MEKDTTESNTKQSLIIHSIGHSNLSISKFIYLLQENNIQLVMDVRSAPYSKYVTQFNRENLARLLHEAGIDYYFSGKELGGRPKDASCYKDKQIPNEKVDYLSLVDYPVVMTKPFFQLGIERLMALAEDYRIAIMCSEEDPSLCHRHHLIGRYLVEKGVRVLHIRSDGNVVSDQQLPNLIEKTIVEQLDLFE